MGQLEVKGSNGAKTYKYIEYSIFKYSIVQSIGLIYHTYIVCLNLLDKLK